MPPGFSILLNSKWVFGALKQWKAWSSKQPVYKVVYSVVPFTALKFGKLHSGSIALLRISVLDSQLQPGNRR
jgi:hypothetical protein